MGTTRNPAKLDRLRALGAEPVILDGLDGAAVGEAVARAEPEVVIHQMTTLAGANLGNMRRWDREFAATNQLRTTGTDHLLAAAQAAGARRFIAQGYAGWPGDRTGPPVQSEDDPLDPDPPAGQREDDGRVPPPGAGGPGGGRAGRPGAPVRIPVWLRGQRRVLRPGPASARCRLSAVGVGHLVLPACGPTPPRPPRPRWNTVARGVYNVVDDEPATVAEWLPFLAQAVGGKPPYHIPAWLGLVAAGEVGISMMTQVRGCANAKAKRELGWQLQFPSWRQGFTRGLAAPARSTAADA